MPRTCSRRPCAPRRCRGTPGTSSFIVYAHVGCGTTTLMPASTAGSSDVDVALRVLPELLGVARVEPRHPAADLSFGQVAREPVVLEHADHRLADRRLLVLDEARREQRARDHARRDPFGVRFLNHFENRTRGERRQQPVARDAGDLLHEEPHRLHVASTRSRPARASSRPCLAGRCARAAARSSTDLPSRLCTDSERSMSCGKSIRHSCRWSGVYGQMT